MTDQEAIEMLNSIKEYLCAGNPIYDTERVREAIEIAVSTLDSVVHGEWVEDYNNTYSRRRMKCSVCGKFSGIGGIKINQLKPFCPNCGARMSE